MKKMDLFNIGTKIVMIILMIILIYMLLLKVTGHSPATDTIFAITQGIIATGVLNLYYKVGRLEGRFSEFLKRFDENRGK